MNIKKMTLQQLVDHADHLRDGSGISDYSDCFDEMLRRLKGK